MKLERLGVFGGTFDPIHIGHLAVADAASSAAELDRVLFVVAEDPWQKTGATDSPRKLSSSGDRLAMVEAAVSNLEEFEACDVEIKRGGPSYMADTLKELRKKDVELFLIMGIDVAREIESWERPSEVKELAKLIVVDRPGCKTDELPAGWDAIRVEGPHLDISGTDIRKRLLTGDPVRFILPEVILKLIAERKLYQSDD